MNWKEVNEYIYRKSTGLMKHENDIHAKKPSHTPKTSARVVFDKSHAVVISDRDRTFYVVSTSVFFEVMHRVLPEATKKYPDYFGKNDAYKVLDAVYNTRPVGTPENFPEFIRREHFAYIFEIKDDKIIDKLLRVDFFRIIEKAKEGEGYDFTGGVFHALKHFNFEGVPLSTNHENFNLPHPTSIIRHFINAFFFHDLQETDKKNISMATIPLSDDAVLEVYFFQEADSTDIYFINSAVKKSKR